MGKSKRPATKAFLRGLSTARTESVPQAEPPTSMRAFGVELTKLKSGTIYEGGRDGCYLMLWKDGSLRWTMRIRIGTVSIQPSLTSSSPAAAIRNLRGTLQNLHISIEKFLKKKEHVKWLKKPL